MNETHGGQLITRHTFGFMVKISRVRSVESLRSRSVIGIDNVEVEVRLSVVGAVSSDRRPLCYTIYQRGLRRQSHDKSCYLLERLPLARVESLARCDGDVGPDTGRCG